MNDTPNPEEIARQIAVETAEEAGKVGDFVERLDLGDNVYDFRFESQLPGYEKWQWSVILFHDVEVDAWTVNESCLAPTEGALMPPPWVPWKERLLPSDLSVTDALGTPADDPRLEEGFRKTGEAGRAAAAAAAVTAADSVDEAADDPVQTSHEPDDRAGEADEADSVEVGPVAGGSQTADASPSVGADEASELDEVVEEYRLSRRRVLSRLGRSEVAQRWYDGPHGPKSLSTKTAGGKTCETCGFFIPLQGGLTTMFGVCANQWSPDDGRVVSLDHGCGEHSEIAPPIAETLWPDRDPVFDDTHIDVVKQAPREEVAEVEVLESLDGEDVEVGTGIEAGPDEVGLEESESAPEGSAPEAVASEGVATEDSGSVTVDEAAGSASEAAAEPAGVTAPDVVTNSAAVEPDADVDPADPAAVAGQVD